jgi:hypothetical protein
LNLEDNASNKGLVLTSTGILQELACFLLLVMLLLLLRPQSK